MTRTQRLARRFRQSCNVVALFLAVVAFLKIVTGQGAVGGLLLLIALVVVYGGLALSHFLKEPDWQNRAHK